MMNIHREKSEKRIFSDVLGMGSALLCLIHCLAAPILMTAGLNFTHLESSFFLHESWEVLFLLFGFVAVFISTRQKSPIFLKIILWISFGLLMTSIVLEHANPAFEYSVYIASSILILGHLLHLKHLAGRKNN